MMTAVEIAVTAVSGPGKVQERLRAIAAASASRSAPLVAHPLPARRRPGTIVRRKATASAVLTVAQARVARAASSAVPTAAMVASVKADPRRLIALRTSARISSRPAILRTPDSPRS